MKKEQIIDVENLPWFKHSFSVFVAGFRAITYAHMEEYYPSGLFIGVIVIRDDGSNDFFFGNAKRFHCQSQRISKMLNPKYSLVFSTLVFSALND